MKTETPRDAAGAKLCAWCGGKVQQSGVGRSKDYCKRLCRDQAYKKRRDQRLVDEAVAAAAVVSPSVEMKGPVSPSVSPDGETQFPQVAPRIPAPVADDDYLLAPPAAPVPVLALSDAWREPAPALAPRRPLSRRRSSMSASPMPLPFEIEDDEGI